MGMITQHWILISVLTMLEEEMTGGGAGGKKSCGNFDKESWKGMFCQQEQEMLSIWI